MTYEEIKFWVTVNLTEGTYPLFVWIVGIILFLSAVCLCLIICRFVRKPKRVFVFVSVFLLLSLLFVYENIPCVRKYSVNMGIKAPIRVVQLSDFHYNTSYSVLPDIAIDMLNRQNPHIVVFTGDFKTDKDSYDLPEAFLKKLSKIKAKKIYFILGNHDNFKNRDKVIKELERINFICADEKTFKIEDGFYLTGVNYEKCPQVLVRRGMFRVMKKSVVPYESEFGKYCLTLPKGKYIFLNHIPQIFFDKYYSDDIFKDKEYLFITGHVHGGQVVIPGSEKRLSKKYAVPLLRGFCEVKGNKVFINSGIGTSYIPIRFNAKPEVSVFDIY